MEENSNMMLNEDNTGSPLTIKTPKSNKNDTDVRRWASVVKAHKSILNSPEVNRFASENDDTFETFHCLPDIVSENYENHKGFITLNKNSFFCQICSLDIDTMVSLTNHLKTRKHEDNVIVFLKDKLPSHLEHTMEFVSFCKSDLCCNLCQETIDMSLNPHETLLNIIAHNTDMTHAGLRANHEGHSLAQNLLNILSETQPEIMQNLNFVDKKIIPQFKCKLCNKNITYSENVDLLEKHFISHFKSLGHVKNQKAVEVLKQFDDVSTQEKEKFCVLNGNIICTVCNHQVETDLENLIVHVKGVEHASKSLAELKLFSLDVKIENKDAEANKICIKKTNVFKQKTEIEEIKKEEGESDGKVCQDSKLNKLLNTLPPDLRQIDYLMENDNGSVTCLVCNCVVPPCKHNLIIHLKGNNHQRKVESKKNSTFEETKNQMVSQTVHRKLSQPPSLKRVLKTVAEKLGFVNCIVPNHAGGAKCLVCDCDLPLIPSTIEEHIKGLIHTMKMDSQWIKKCSACPSSSAEFNKDKIKIPTALRCYGCQSVNKTEISSIHDDYSLLLEKNVLISKNKNLLEINVDGKNCYCKLCKSLIPLSSNICDLETNLVSHLIGKTHVFNSIKKLGKKLEEVQNTPQSSSAGKVVRSLFVFSNGNENKKADTKMEAHEALSSFNETLYNFTTPSLKRKLSGAAKSQGNSQKNSDSEVFIFGKNENNEQCNLENLKNKKTASKTIKEKKALPVSKASRSPMMEVETDVAILSRRQKQLDYGKNTDGYTRYRKVVPLSKRRLNHPMTPPKHIKCSRRTWDGMVKAWRKKLHDWDLPQVSTSLEQDIQALPLQVC